MMGLGMLFALPSMILIWLAVLALPVLGILWLGRVITTQAGQPLPGAPSATGSCPKCHRSVQKEWRNCPYCGDKLA